MNDTGLPDYVADHFQYLVRSSSPARTGQVAFFGSGLLLPVMFLLIPVEPVTLGLAPLIVTGTIFFASFLWYLVWMQGRLNRFRTERPASYARWFGLRRSGPFGGFHLLGQLRLAKMQARYLLTSREPSPAETFALTMYFVRNSSYNL